MLPNNFIIFYYRSQPKFHNSPRIIPWNRHFSVSTPFCGLCGPSSKSRQEFLSWSIWNKHWATARRIQMCSTVFYIWLRYPNSRGFFTTVYEMSTDSWGYMLTVFVRINPVYSTLYLIYTVLTESKIKEYFSYRQTVFWIAIVLLVFDNKIKVVKVQLKVK